MFTGIEVTATIIQTNFHYNSAHVYGIFLMNAVFNFIECDFENNTANAKSPNIFSAMSQITIIDSKFNNDNVSPALSQIEDIEIQGYYLLAQSNSVINITNSEFNNGYAFRGGAIAVTSCIYIYIYIILYSIISEYIRLYI